MSEVTTHPAGFRIRDRRGEHAAPTAEVVGRISTIGTTDGRTYPAPEGMTERISVGWRGESVVTGSPRQTPEGFVSGDYRPSLADVRHARSVLAGARGTYAAPLDDDDRGHRYALQEICRTGVGVRGYRQLTARQRRRIRHKANRALRYLTPAVPVQ